MVAVHPRPGSIDIDWDGIVLPHVIVCTRCGTADEYEVEPSTLDELRARAACARSRGSVVQAELRIWDGTVTRRPLDMLRRLRELAERHSSCGEAWRRYGNALEKLDRLSEAKAAWTTAVAVDEDEFVAAVCLAELAHEQDAEDVWERIAGAFERCGWLHRKRTREAHALAGRTLGSHYGAESVAEYRNAVALLVHILKLRASEAGLGLMVAWSESGAEGSGGSITLTLSAIDLFDVTRWDRLAEFLGSSLVVSARLGASPDEPPGFLQEFIESDVPLSALSRLAGTGGQRPSRASRALVMPRIESAAVWRSSSKKANRHRKRAQAR
jgi:hypothetical protein